MDKIWRRADGKSASEVVKNRLTRDAVPGGRAVLDCMGRHSSGKQHVCQHRFGAANITGYGTYTFSGALIPPINIVMGTYQDPIFTANISGAVTGSATLYSTAAYSEPAPSGFVDGSNAANPVSVDFSSFRLNVNITSPFALTFDTSAWPLATPNISSTYNAGTHAYTLSWANNFSVKSLVGTPISGTLNVTLGGTFTSVPLPTAFWLFGSGLVGLATFAYRRRPAAFAA